MAKTANEISSLHRDRTVDSAKSPVPACLRQQVNSIDWPDL
ncbi:hypothetical protein Rcae01_01442 [Novipirellula caenicola]|uniref:Uncharacterized protein n=1 Tax=Novipirellula caenicola TaxID=1536901 RepID=A0ABP9VLB9_9BACT